MNNHFTPTQKSILEILSDGKMHRREEFKQCLSDDLAPITAIHYHISTLRAKIRGIGENIMFIRDGKQSYYQIRRTLGSPYK